MKTLLTIILAFVASVSMGQSKKDTIYSLSNMQFVNISNKGIGQASFPIRVGQQQAYIRIYRKNDATGHYVIHFKRKNLYWVNDSTAVYKP